MKGFRPGLVPSLVVAVLVPVMVCLGFWQLSRGEQKRVLMDTYAERRVAPPMDSTELTHTADPAGAPWPRLVTAIEPDKLWADLGRNGFAYELRQQSGPGAYRTDWPVVAMGPEKHLGYAVQWFAMAAALLGLFLYLGWHNAGRHHGKHHESNQHV